MQFLEILSTTESYEVGWTFANNVLFVIQISKSANIQY